MAGVTHFLIIAVENHINTTIPPVTFATDDANGLVKAWQELDHDPTDFEVLLNGAATKTAIEACVKKISGKAGKDDRIVIFFAGHGCAVNGENMIVPADARLDMLGDTCVSIDRLLGYLKKAESERNLLFLDCCHSGFEPGEHIRRIASGFSMDDLIAELKDQTYCIGFASCKSHEESIAHPAVRHGVWTHFLIQALSGNAPEEVYDGNLLLSDKLQTWLRKQTADFIKKHKVAGHTQTPMVFGSFTDKFEIADLTPVFEAREAARRAAAFNMTSIVLFDTDDGRVKDLPDFKNGHKVPDRLGSAQERFVKTASGEMASDEIDDMSERIARAMGYGVNDFKTEKGNGYAAIQTPDFSYSIEISQSTDDHKKYMIKRTLDGVYNDDIINDPRFNDLFDNHFRQLSFQFDKRINVRDFIARVEKKAAVRGIELKFSPTNPTSVRIIFPGSDNEIVVDENTINITIPRAESPAQLVKAYKETSKQLDGAKMNLLEP